MRRTLTASAMMAATALAGWTDYARAEPPTDLSQGSFRHPMIVCHAGDQVKQLVEAQKVSDERVKEVKASLGKNCGVAYVHNVVIGESEDLGIVKTGDTMEHLWLIHIGTPTEEFFGLYEEKADEGTQA